MKNREIKFRGFYEITKTWFYGYLIPRDLLEDPHFLEPLWIATGMETECYPVDKDSIGQFIGLTDKNRKEIYEGDIICLDKDGFVGVVEYNPQNACFLIQSKAENRIRQIIEVGMFSDGDIYQIDAEIFGNVHQNPELLK